MEGKSCSRRVHFSAFTCQLHDFRKSMSKVHDSEFGSLTYGKLYKLHVLYISIEKNYSINL